MFVFLLLLSVAFTGSLAFTGFRSGQFLQRSSTSLNYNVRIINKKRGTDQTIDIPDDQIILDYAENQGITTIPYSCRAGSCSSCIGMMKSGEVDQTGNIFLADAQVEEGYVLTCVAMPMTDCEIEVDIEDAFYNANPDLKIE